VYFRRSWKQDFYKGYLRERHGIDLAVPDADARTVVHDIIFNELCQGIVSPESKRRYIDVITHAKADGIDSVIFGCTEVGLLITPDDLDLPAFDTTELHARAALDFAIGD